MVFLDQISSVDEVKATINCFFEPVSSTKLLEGQMASVLEVLKQMRRVWVIKGLTKGMEASGDLELSKPLDSSDLSRDPYMGSMGEGNPFLIKS